MVGDATRGEMAGDGAVGGRAPLGVGRRTSSNGEGGGADRQRGRRWPAVLGERQLHRGAGGVKADALRTRGSGWERGPVGMRGSTPWRVTSSRCPGHSGGKGWTDGDGEMTWTRRGGGLGSQAGGRRWGMASLTGLHRPEGVSRGLWGGRGGAKSDLGGEGSLGCVGPGLDVLHRKPPLTPDASGPDGLGDRGR